MFFSFITTAILAFFVADTAFAEMRAEALRVEDAPEVLRLAMKADPLVSGEKIRDSLQKSLNIVSQSQTLVMRDPDGRIAGFVIYNWGFSGAEVESIYVRPGFERDVDGMFFELRRLDRPIHLPAGSKAESLLRLHGIRPVMEERPFSTITEADRRHSPRTPYEQIDTSELHSQTICEFGVAALGAGSRSLAALSIASPVLGYGAAISYKKFADYRRSENGQKQLRRGLDTFKNRAELREALADAAANFRVTGAMGSYVHALYLDKSANSEVRRGRAFRSAGLRESLDGLEEDWNPKDRRALDYYLADYILENAPRNARARGYGIKNISDLMHFAFPDAY